MLDLLASTLTFEFLRYAVGREIYCPTCQDVLDVNRAVQFDNGQRGGVLCARCWDEMIGRVLSRGGRPDPKLEVIDGRNFDDDGYPVDSPRDPLALRKSHGHIRFEGGCEYYQAWRHRDPTPHIYRAPIGSPLESTGPMGVEQRLEGAEWWGIVD